MGSAGLSASVLALAGVIGCGRLDFSPAPPRDAAGPCTCDGDVLACPGVAPTTCPLTCATTGDGPHCTTLVPSNGVDPGVVAGAGAIEITGATTFDTDTGAVTGAITRAAGGGVIASIAFDTEGSSTAPLGVFGFDALTIDSGARVEVTGTRAAVFVVATDLALAGAIDASGGCIGGTQACAGPGGGSGAVFGATAGGCGPGHDGVTDVATGADSGGGGGGAGTAGAAGGTETAANKKFAGGDGGAPCLAATLEPLVGGSGGGGGGPGAAAAGTPGGGGGGALQLSVLGTLTIAGAINAAGAGGSPGPIDMNNGGAPGGGGAGGAILLEAPVVAVTGTIAANGGGGGGGTDHVMGGTRGDDGALGVTPAAGGMPGGSAGAGGAGGAGSIAPVVGADASDANSGAGGGAVGRIFIRAKQAAAQPGTFSPSPGLDVVRSQ